MYQTNDPFEDGFRKSVRKLASQWLHALPFSNSCFLELDVWARGQKVAAAETNKGDPPAGK